MTNKTAATVATKTDANGPMILGLEVSIRRLHFHIQAELGKTIARFGLRLGAVGALTAICAKPGISQTELAAVLAMERSNLVTIVDTLAQRGLIERQVVAGDRRRQALMPTSEGIGLSDQAKLAIAA